MGKLHHFLGMTVVQDEEKKTVWIGQPISLAISLTPSPVISLRAQTHNDFYNSTSHQVH